MATRGWTDTLSVLDCDPDLGEDLNEAQLVSARGQAYANARCYPRGSWKIPQGLEPAADLGLLIVKGFMIRELTVADYTCAELLGPGDVFQPWQRPAPEPSVAARVEWAALDRVRIAWLDRDFLVRVSTWPEIISALSDRMSWRAHGLAFQLALSALRRIDDRVMLMLWGFADRWGTVTPDGVLLDIPLTHELIASLVGARRPSVSAAVGRLVDRRQIRSRPRSRWLLLRQPDLNA